MEEEMRRAGVQHLRPEVPDEGVELLVGVDSQLGSGGRAGSSLDFSIGERTTVAFKSPL